MVEAFYRAGSLVFGGGHVVVPLLQAQTPPWLVVVITAIGGAVIAQVA